VVAAVISNEGIEIVPVSVVSRVTQSAALVCAFNLRTFRHGGRRTTAKFAQPLLRATLAHLDGTVSRTDSSPFAHG